MSNNSTFLYSTFFHRLLQSTCYNMLSNDCILYFLVNGISATNFTGCGRKINKLLLVPLWKVTKVIYFFLGCSLFNYIKSLIWNYLG